MNQFTKSIALDLAPFGIRANSINPGAIRTSLLSTIGFSSEQIDSFFQLLKESTPVGRVGEVGDTSAAIAYLASDEASFVTGVTLPVDGGTLLVGGFNSKTLKK